MHRREFITLLGGAAVAWPLAAHAQPSEGVRRLAVLMALPETDPEAKALLSEFTQGLAGLGWADGRNMRMDVRWAASNLDLMRKFAKELVDLQPDVILANSTPATAALQNQTQTIPIVFAIVGDPVGSGFIASLSHPGRNITGLGMFEESMPSKWLDLLTEIAPGFKRAAFMFNPDTAPYINSFLVPSFETAAEALKVAPIVAPVHSDAEIEAVITSLGREPGVLSSSGRTILWISITRQLYLWRRGIMYLRSITRLLAPETAGCFPTEQTSKIYFAGPPGMWPASSAAQSLLNSRFKCQ